MLFTKDTLCQIVLPAGYHTYVSTNVDTKLDTTAKALAIIFHAPRTESVDRVLLSVAALIGTPTYSVRIEGVDTNGDPDGTDIGSTAANFSPVGTGMTTITLGASGSLTQNTPYAIVISDAATGNSPSTGVHEIDVRAVDFRGGVKGDPYVSLSTDFPTTPTWAEQNQYEPLFGVGTSATDIYGTCAENIDDLSTQVSTAGHRIAQKYIIPTSFGSRVKVNGLSISTYLQADFKYGIWDTDNNEIVATGTIDSSVGAWGATVHNMALFWSGVWLQTGKAYYFGFELVGAVASAVAAFDAGSDNNLSCCLGYPDNNLYTYAPSTWTVVTGKCSMAGYLLVEDWDKHGIEMDHLTEGMNR